MYTSKALNSKVFFLGPDIFFSFSFHSTCKQPTIGKGNQGICVCKLEGKRCTGICRIFCNTHSYEGRFCRQTEKMPILFVFIIQTTLKNCRHALIRERERDWEKNGKLCFFFIQLSWFAINYISFLLIKKLSMKLKKSWF